MILQALTPDDLPKVAEAEHAAHSYVEHTIRVCMAAGCLSQHSDQIKQRLELLEDILKGCQWKG